MENNINIPETYPQKEALQKVSKTLLEFLPLHSIYFSVEDTEPDPRTIITLFLSKECAINSEDVEPFVERVFRPYPQFTFVLFEVWWAAELWEQGSSYFMLHATESELAYSSDPENIIFSFKQQNSKKLIRNAEKHYLEINSWANNSFTSVTWYERYGDYKQSAFHLHQALKHTFQLASWILSGEYTSSESLREQQLYIINAAPAFGKLFDTENAEEQEALQQLDNACISVRQNETYEFTGEAVLLSVEKAKQFSGEVAQLFKARIQKCKTKIKAKQAAEGKDTIEGADNALQMPYSSIITDFISELRDTTFFKLSHKRQRENKSGFNLEFTNYTELLFTIRDMLKIALHTLYNDDLENSGQIADPSFHLQRLLEITVQLIPHGEGEILDKCQDLHLQLKKQDKATTRLEQE